MLVPEYAAAASTNHEHNKNLNGYNEKWEMVSAEDATVTTAAAATIHEHRICNTVFLSSLLIANAAQEKIIGICVLRISIRAGHNL